MSDEESGWHITESDPGVFTELLKTLGVPLIVDDLYSLDPSTLASLQPLHALIFLFKWVAPADSSEASVDYDDAFEGFFANQVVNNACATLAVLNGVCNIPGVGMGSELRGLVDFTTGMDPQTRGLAITSSEFLREAHNSLSPPSALSLADLDLGPRDKEDAYHFIVYTPVNGVLYELDGLKRSPVRHGVFPSTGEGWVALARDVIQKRIETYPPGSLHFNLQAIRTDPLPGLRRELEALQAGGHVNLAQQILRQISAEEDKRQRWAFENSLRRHNPLGLIHALLLGLAKAGGLEAATTGAKEKMKERIAKAREEAAKGKK
ncbi:cysteine proteinase [Sistotremastrum niveocremeum HHB9708]|uniref:Ubiquitin carboxyl-terminal hydrolase n=1 Tax=Sistotremastrum niveocremeum HHB9708 TaxID=1314777 RepID=A0A164PGT9_9AGAM|nr:cysteine proteinase [Sistotremastrum niveocremeum HHB9708]